MPEEEVLQPDETPVTETVSEPSDTEALQAVPAATVPEEAVPAEAVDQTLVTEGAESEDGESADAESEEGEPAADAGPTISTVVEVDAVVEGVVQRITPYGAFLNLPGGKLGLVHISEIDRNYVKDVHDHLREGDTAQAKVLAIKEDGKIDLSIKALQDPQPRVERRRGSDPGFEQMLRKFMRASEERQVDVKRSVMHKRK
jgi:S1 RNA binding domain protein